MWYLIDTKQENRVPFISEDASVGRGEEASQLLEQLLEAYVHWISPVSFASVEKRFYNLEAAWKREKRFLSSHTEIVLNSNYQQIIGMGRNSLPFILNSLMKEPDYWFHALFAITGEDVVPLESRGNLDAMTEAWLNWAKTRG